MALNYYDVLGIRRNASKAQIKSAYRKLALRYHPDKNPGNRAAQKKFIEIANAYQILTNQSRRTRYNRSMDEGDMEAFQQYWEQVKPETRPPPPPYYYTYAREEVIYSRETYVLGGLAVAGIIGLALLIPFFLLQMSSEQNYQKAVNLYYAQKYSTALHYLDIAMSEFGNKEAEAAALAAVILTHKLKNHDYALKYIRKGLNMTTGDSLRSELQYMKGLCLYHKGLPDKAISAFEAVNKETAKKDSALFMMGIVFSSQKEDPSKGLQYFNAVLLNDKGFNKARYFRALALQATGKHQEAIADLQYLIDNNYQPAASYYHKARSEIAQDRVGEACLDLRMAMRYKLEEAKNLYALYCSDSADAQAPEVLSDSP